MRILCDYLVVHEFLTKECDEYGLTPTSAVFLDKRSPGYMGGITRFVNSADQLHAFHDVAELVRRGTTAAEYGGWTDFARCMVPMMMPVTRK